MFLSLPKNTLSGNSNLLSVSAKTDFSTILSKSLISCLLLIVGVTSINGATYYSRQTGNWSSNNTWSLTSGGGSAGAIPGSGDNVVIENYTVTLDINSGYCNNFTLTSGQFIMNTANNTNRTLNIGGNYTQSGTGIFDFNTKTSGTETMNLAGNLTITSTASSLTTSGTSTNGTIVFNGNGTQTLNFTNPQCADYVKYNVASTSNLMLLSSIGLVQSSTSGYKGEITVNGSIDLGIYTITNFVLGSSGLPIFTLNSGGTLITANTGGVNGSIPSTNTTCSFSTGANYTFSGTSAQITSASMPTTVNNLTIANSGSSVTLSASTTISGNLLISSGTLSTSANNYNMTVGGNWTNNGGTFSPGTGTVTMTGTPMTIGGSASSTFNNLYLGTSNNQRYSLGNNQTVNGILTISNNVLLTLGANNLILGATASIGNMASMYSGCMIIINGSGLVQKMITANGSFTFPIGDNTPNYSPITLNFISGTYGSGAYVAVNVTNAKEPNNPNTTNYFKRYWTVSQSGVSSFVCNVTGTFGSTNDLSGDWALQKAALYTGSLPWVYYSPISSSPNPYSFTANGVTTFGNFTGMGYPSFTTTTSSLTGFTYASGHGPSSNQQFSVTANNLTNPFLVTPPTDFEVSVDNSTYQSTPLTLPQSGGAISNKTVYVRLKAGLPSGTYANENIVCSSTGTANINVTASGSVTPSAYYSITTGNWNINTTWAFNSGGSAVPAGAYPLPGDNVYIEKGYTVTINTPNATCANLTLGGQGNTGSLTFATTGSPVLIVSGAVQVGCPDNNNSHGIITFVSGASMTAGSLAMGNTSTTSNSTLTMTTGSTLTMNGAITVPGSGAKTWTPGAGTVIMNATNTLPSTIVTSFNNLTCNAGNTTTGVGLTVNGNLSISDGATFTVPAFPLTVTGTTSVGNGTSGALAISSATGTKTFTGAVTINGGGAMTESAAAALSFGSDITINPNGTLTESGAAVVGIAGNLTDNGIYNAGTGTHTFSGTNKTISGTGVGTANATTIPTAIFTGTYSNNCNYLNISTSLTVTGVTLTNNTSLGVTNIGGTGALTQGTGALLSIGGSSTIATLTATANNTVVYSNGAQTIFPTTYYNLTFSNSGTKTANTGLNILGSITLGSGTTFTAGSYTHSVGGNWINNGGTFTNTGSTINFNGSAAQTIGGSTSTIFNNFSIANTGAAGSNTVTLNRPSSVSGILNLVSGILTTTSGNLLSVTNTASTSITGGSTNTYINGPVAWTLPASLASGSIYTFPVGNTSFLPFALVNPITGSGTVTAQVLATNNNSSGAYDNTLNSISTTEYWSLVTSGNFTNSSVSLTNSVPISPLNAIGGSTTLAGNYTSLGGTAATNGVSNSTSIGTNRYFILAQVSPITTGTISGSPFCSGSAVSVPYTISGTYTSGNVFTAQLSDGSGSFASPVSIGTLSSTAAGTISATIPAGTITGNGYRIRVVSNNPSKTGTDNGSNLSIYAISAAPTTIGGNLCIGTTSSVILSASGAGSSDKYRWYNAATGGTLLYTSTGNADNSYTTPALGATTNYWVSIMNGGGCEGPRAQVTATYPAASTDTQTPGTDSWIGYVYEGISFATYYGHYTEAETFNESFGGNTTCFPITSNSNALSIYTETYSVKYLMNSTKKGLYVVDLGSDDGNRLTVDGALIYTDWNDHAISSHPSVLMNLKGTSSLMYEYYENGGANVVSFQNLTQVLANTLSTNTSQTIFIGATGAAISGDVYGTLPTGITKSGTGYQWTYSTTPGGLRTNISGATGATYTPTAASAPFNTPGTYYLYRNAILSSTNNVSPTTYVATNESNAATLTIGYPSIWLKADMGTSTTTDGTGVSSWNDQSGMSNNATAQLTAPTYQSLGWNFNPTINFSAGYFLSATNNIYNDMTYFVVYNSTQNATNTAANFYMLPAIIGCETNGTQNDYTLSTNGGKLFFKGTVGDNLGAQTAAAYNDNYPKIVSVTRQKSTNANTINLYVNGATAATATSDNNSLSDPQKIGIGNHYSYVTSAQFVGGISEVFGIQNLYTTNNLQSFESYLAVKYGVTLSHNYTKSDNATVYTISGYGNDVAGLGRDDAYGLNQKISSSSNYASGPSKVVIATSNDFTSSNLSGTRTVLTNLQYLIWGNNGAAVTTKWIPAAAGSLDSITNRIWQVQNTGPVGPVYFQIDLTGYPVSVTGIYALLVDNNTDFSSGVTSYTLTNVSGNIYALAAPSGVIFPSGTSYFTISPKRNYWVGSPSSNDWGNVSNWSAGIIPPDGKNIEFATTTNNGVAALNELKLDHDRKIGNLINSSSQRLVIPPSLCLTVNGTIASTNDNNIYIQSSSTLANGSLIFPNATNVHGTVEMYSMAYKSATADPNGYFYKWQYFGIPVNTITASPTFDGSFVRKLVESGTTIANHWVNVNNTFPLQPGIGYELTQNVSAGKTIIFQGQLVNWDVTSPQLPYTLSTPAALFPGQNILANPFAAAIDITKVVFGSDMQQSVWLYSTGSYGDWNSTPGSTSPGQYTVVLPGPSGLGMTSQIPSMQGMLVQFKPTITASSANSWVKLPYSAVIKNVEAQRVKGTTGSPSSDQVCMRIDVAGSKTSDKMWLFTQPGCSRTFDNGWDGAKILGEALAPQIYAIEPDNNYQVDAVEDMNNTFLGFQAGADTEYALTFTHQNLASKYAGVFLVDLVENKTIDITESGSTYSFVAESTPAPVKRFMIATRNIEKNAPDAETQLKVFSSGRTIFVQNQSNQSGELVIYDMLGRYLKKVQLGPNGITSVQAGTLAGTYLTKASTATESVSKSIMIGK